MRCGDDGELEPWRSVIYATAFANEAGAALNAVVPGLYDSGARVADRPLAVASRLTIDLVALLSIVVVALMTYNDQDFALGPTLTLTSVTLFFAFLLPGVIIEPIVEGWCRKCGAATKVLVGGAIIVALYIAETLTRGAIAHRLGPQPG